jgi:ferredoxin-NADP reductase
MLGEVIKPFDKRARVYVCEPTLLVEAVANALVQMELPTEQFVRNALVQLEPEEAERWITTRRT